MKHALFFLSGVLAGFPAPAAEQAASAPLQQARAAAQACAACHGTQGEGNPGAGFPRIAAQSQAYLVKQLESYANRSRKNAVMEPIAKGLTLEARAELSAYYSQLSPAAAKTASASVNERGRTLASKGDPKLRVQGCINCHGPGGIGEPPSIPYIAGLDAAYLAATLTAWKEGTRRNDAGQQMATVARALSAEDIKAVAEFYATLTPPKPVAIDVVQAPAAPSKGGVQAKPTVTAPAEPQSNVGVEQGSATTGGTQGPGGSGESKTNTGPATTSPQGAGKGGSSK